MFSHDDSENEAEQEDTDDFQWRKDRYEREKFIKEETVNIVPQIDVKLYVCLFFLISICVGGTNTTFLCCLLITL